VTDSTSTPTPARLDDWIGRAAVRTHHRRVADTDPEQLWQSARQVRLSDTRTLGRMVRWRIPGTPARMTFDELFRSYPFTVLDEGERHIVSGLCGKIWTLQRDYPRLDGPGAFRDWNAAGTVRVAFAHWVQPDGDGGAELFSEARVEPVDRTAGLRLRGVWAVIGPFERLVGAEALTAAVQRSRRR
jgi:hypothetical protein